MSSNDVANESRVPQVLAGIIIPTVLSSLFVLARLYTRLIITRNWGTDDTFISAAWIASLGLAVGTGLLTRFGSGHHQIFLTPADIVPTLKLAFISRLIYQFVLCLTKIGICVFYLRVFQDRQSKRWVYAITGFVVLSALIIEFAFVFSCNPISDAWASSNPHCVSSVPSTVANAVCNILADVFLMIFVIPRVLPLQMARRQKFSLLAVVSLGILVITAAIVRVYLVTSLAGNSDLTWNGYEITTWTTVEVSISLFCASVPCIRPLLRQIAPGFMSSISQTLSGPSNGRTGGTGHVYGAGTGTGLSLSTRRKDRAEAYELRSTGGEGLTPGSGLTGNSTFWVGKGGEKDYSDGEDASSERGVFQSSSHVNSKNDILKTVSVTITDGERSKSSVSVSDSGGVDGLSRENPVVRFELV